MENKNSLEIKAPFKLKVMINLLLEILFFIHDEMRARL